MIFRWIIFIGAIILIYNLVSSNPSNILGDTTVSLNEQVDVLPVLDTVITQLPPESQELIKNFNKTPLYLEADKKISEFQKNLNGFPQKQIKQFKLNLIKSIYDYLIKSVEGN